MVIALLIICVFSFESALASTLENQLDKIGNLASGKVKTIGISSAVILSSIVAIVRGNIRFAGVIVAIGIILSCYLDWIFSGMKVS